MKYLFTLLISLAYMLVFTAFIAFFKNSLGLSEAGNIAFCGSLLCGVTTVVCTCIIIFRDKK